MLTITENAKEKLKKRLQTKTTDPEMAVRLVAKSNQFALFIDKEKKGDKVIESETGAKLLLIEPNLYSELDGRVVDYQEKMEGSGFTITAPAFGD
jgi:Fe-S cluster assembly iron-binding protein IscA